ncbi:MAG: hypothetical protein EXR79_14920 [Myxococcales bacterium]|nr:hypothetical protein [Myxococcales bacterium]
MAHRILGLDIGSRSIKAAFVDKTMRSAVLTGFDSEAVVVVPPPPAPLAADGEVPKKPDARAETRADAERLRTAQGVALQKLLQRNLRPDDVVAVAMPAAACLNRALTFPFRDEKALQEAVGFELENHIPAAIADFVVDHLAVGEHQGATEVIALAAPREEVRARIDLCKAAGIDPRRLGLSTLAWSSLVGALAGLRTGMTMVVDIGVRATEVAVCQEGQVVFLRTLSVGAEACHALFAQQFQGVDGKNDLLEAHGWLLPPGLPPETPDQQTVHEATAQALTPLLRELRLTLAGWMKRAHARPDRIALHGGLARLAGLHPFLEGALGVPVGGVPLASLTDGKVDDADAHAETHSLAVALALDAATPAGAAHDVDFRQGDFAYEGDFKVLRARLPQLAVFLVVALCLMGIRTSLEYRALIIEREAQVARLQGLSKALTGKATDDFDAVKLELEKPSELDMAALYPDLSAFKALEEITKIIDRVTEPPDFKAPGPGEESPPMIRPPEGMPAPTFRGLPNLDGSPPEVLMNADRIPRPSLRAIGGDPTGPAGAANDPAFAPGERAAERAAPGRGDPGGSGFPGASVDPDAEPAADAPKPFEGHQIELSAVQIERGNVTLRGDVDSQEGLLALQQAIDAHRCFSKIKPSSDRITFERHQDWFKFTLQFEIACPREHKKPSGAKKAADDDGEEE